MRAILTLVLVLIGVVQAVRADEKTDLPIPTTLAVTPSAFTIRGADNVQRLIVGAAAKSGDARTFDYSRQATYVSSDPKVAIVTKDGLVIPKGNGSARITATFGRKKVVAQATVAGYGEEPPVSFRNQVVPILHQTRLQFRRLSWQATRAE